LISSILRLVIVVHIPKDLFQVNTVDGYRGDKREASLQLLAQLEQPAHAHVFLAHFELEHVELDFVHLELLQTLLQQCVHQADLPFAVLQDALALLRIGHHLVKQFRQVLVIRAGLLLLAPQVQRDPHHIVVALFVFECDC